jgi:hypothetical protein
VAQVRGRDLIDAVLFVGETQGREAHDRVLKALGPEALAAFRSDIRESAWYPLEALTIYLRTAQRVLAPEDPRFFRSQGFFAAQREKATYLGPMVATTDSRARLAPTMWKLFYDVGRLEVVGDKPETAVGRIHDFPVTPELCERFCGIWEGMATTPGRRARAEETRCVRRGDAFCEISLAFDPESS